MIPVTLAKAQTSDSTGFVITSVILLDEQKQRALPIWLYQPGEGEGIALHTSLQKDLASTTLARPRTLDLLTELLKALGGDLEEVCIHLLQNDLLYAQMYVRDRHGRHAIKALLDDALPLAIRLKSTIRVAETVPESKWVDLAAQGATLEQQLETMMHTMQTNPALLYLKREPRNLDFTDNLQGWQFLGDPERSDYYIDRQTTCTGKGSLAIVLYEKPSNETGVVSPVSALVHHEGFLAEHYRGQRLRMRTCIKTEHIQQINIHLAVVGPLTNNAEDAIGISTSPSYAFETNTTVQSVKDIHDWIQHESVIDVPHDAFTIDFHFIIEGACQIWLDGISFESVDTNIPLTEMRYTLPPQQPRNLDFRHTLEFWQLVSSTHQDYSAGVEQLPDGVACASLKAAVEQSHNVGSLEQFIEAVPYRGKHVSFCASIKTADVTQQASLFLHAEDEQEQTIKGTIDWTYYEVTMYMPERWRGLHFGIKLQGQGQIWLKDVRLETVESLR